MAATNGVALYGVLATKFVTNETVPRTVWTKLVNKVDITDEISEGLDLFRRNGNTVVATNAGLEGSADLVLGSNIKMTCDTFIPEFYAIGNGTTVVDNGVIVAPHSTVHGISGTLYNYTYAPGNTTEYMEYINHDVRVSSMSVPAMDDSDISMWEFEMKSRYQVGATDGFECKKLATMPDMDDEVISA